MKHIRSLAVAWLLLAATADPVQSQTTASDPKSDTLKTATIKVKGITCATDLKTISANVEKVRGVSSCKPGKQGPTTSFEVRFNPSRVTEKEIFATIENTGGCENPDERPYRIKG
jgi:copper chaperone CopZ